MVYCRFVLNAFYFNKIYNYMKNHFFVGYAGNKRNEVHRIYEYMKMDGIKRIIEPFGGTCALSFYISTMEPLKYRYVLNDNCKHLYELYIIANDHEKLQTFNEKVNEILSTITREKYKEIIDRKKKSNQDEYTVFDWFICHKIYAIRPGLFPNNYKYKPLNLMNIPFVNFLRTEKIKFKNEDGMTIIKKYKNNPKNLLFLDPPYIQANNEFYDDTNSNVYEYLYNNDIQAMPAYFVLCLENIWIIKLLFKNCKKSDQYEKKYQPLLKRTTNHIIISNR